MPPARAPQKLMHTWQDIIFLPPRPAPRKGAWRTYSWDARCLLPLSVPHHDLAWQRWRGIQMTRNLGIEDTWTTLKGFGEKRNEIFTAHHRCFFFQAEDGIRDLTVTGVQTCALPI